MQFNGFWAAVCGTCGVIGAAISSMFGGWSAGMTFLVVCMVADYVTGLLVAYVFKKSPKTETGGASSKIGFQGIAKKGCILLVVFIAVQLQRVSGVSYIRDGVVIAYIVNELTSMTENLGLMGVPLPAVLTKAIDVLKSKGDTQDEKGD